MKEIIEKYQSRLQELVRKELDENIDKASLNNEKLNLLLQMEEELKALWQ